MTTKYRFNQLQWCNETMRLTAFLKHYKLPQIIQIDEGVYGLTNEDTFSYGDVLKLHSIVTERKVLCHDDHGQPTYVPFNSTDQIYVITSDNPYKLCDLLHLEPLPTQIIVMQPSFDTIGQSLTISKDDVLTLVKDDDLDEDLDDNGYEVMHEEKLEINFKTRNGLTFTCLRSSEALVKPIYDNNSAFMNQILPNKCGSVSPVAFQVLGAAAAGILTCDRVYDEAVVIVSQLVERGEYLKTDAANIFSLGEKLDLLIKPNKGCMSLDATYEELRKNLHAFPHLENEFLANRNSILFISSNVKNMSKFTCYQNAEVFSRLVSQKDNESKTTEERPTIPLRGESVSDESDLTPDFNRQSKPKTKPPVAPKPIPIPPSQTATVRPNSHLGSAETKQKQQTRTGSLETSQNIDQVSNAVSYVEKGTTGIIDASSMAEMDDYDDILTTSNNDEDETNTLKEIISMSVTEVSELLKTLKMEEHVDLFRNNQIDGFLLSQLDCQEMQDLSLNKFEAKKLLTYVKKGWRPKI